MAEKICEPNRERTAFTASLFGADLPDDWRLVPVGEALTSSQYGLSEPVSPNGSTPIVGMRDISNGTVNLADLPSIDDTGNDWSSMRLKAGDVLLNRTNSPDLVGKVGIVREDSEAVFASYLVRLVVDRQMVEPEFVNYWLNTPVAQRALKRLSTRGVSQANINPTEFRRHCPLPLAPLSEQRKIAEILRTWDEAIEKLEALIGITERRQRALTHSLVFGVRQLDQFRTINETKKHRWFNLPATWGCKPVSQLAREVSERNTNANANALEVLACSKHEGFVRSLAYFKKRVFSADLTGYKKIWWGDFGFPSNHIEEGSIGLQLLSDIGLVSPIYTVFRFDSDKIDNTYAFAALKTGLYRHIFKISTSASVDRRGSLRWSEFSKIPFPVPPLAEQKDIAQVLQTHQRHIDALSVEKEATVRQKRGLMKKLLTGEWRVKR